MKIGKNRLPELLSPCGSREQLEAAIAAGADAVYFGGTVFNARMNAKNFDRDGVRDAVALCHGNGVRAYVTMNTQIYDRELKSALEYAGFLRECGVDALIVSDPGLISLIRKYYPGMELHASTQMTAHNVEAADRLYGMGMKRVVGARELSKENIETLVNGSKAEIEIFIHGAICVSCSGQCLMSAMLGGRSGNRGECAQPCRMSYNGGYPISLKDMCLAGHITELIEAGVASLKIEGRMKSPSYVYGVTKIYRRLLDERRNATQKEMKELADLFSRGGFTDGYYTGKIGSEMLGTRSERDIEQSRKAAPFRVSVPASQESIPMPVPVTLPDKLDFPPKKPARKPILTARFRSAGQIPDSHGFTHVYLPLSKYENTADGVILPPVIFDGDRDETRRKLDTAVKKGAKHIMLGNIGQLDLAKEFDLIPHGDFRLNVFNSFTADFWANAAYRELESQILSCELILPQIRDIYFRGDTLKGAVVYGRTPLMLLEKPVGASQLRDTRGAIFPVVRDEGRDVIHNSVPLYMADQPDRLDAAGIEERHMIFSTENKGDVMRVIYAYAHKVIPKENVRRLK